MPPIVSLFGSLALAATAASSAPQLGDIETFKNWTVGCDNGGDCQAVSLNPENGDQDGWDGPITLVRTAGQDDILKVRVLIPAKDFDRYKMMVDGKLVDTGPIVEGDYPIEIVGEDAKKVVRAIARGHRLQIVGPGDEKLTKVSLAGSAAAIRYIDERQQRAFTQTALVAKGRRKFHHVRTELPLIPINQWATANRIPGTSEVVELVENSQCEDERFGVVEDQVYPMGQKDNRYRALVLVSCGSGAYNFSSAAYIGEISGDESDGAKWSFTPAEFDFQPGWGGEGRAPLLINTDWDETEQSLGSYAKGRGLGDCGSAERYIWDGEKFRLIAASSMSECRGSYEWITTWRANYHKVKQTAALSE